MINNKIGMLLEIEVDRIQPHPDNKHFHSTESIVEMASSIEGSGIIEPLIVRPFGGNLYQIVSGERRWKGAKQAGLSKVPCIIRQDISEESEIALIRLTENRVRDDFHFVSECGELVLIHRAMKPTNLSWFAQHLPESEANIRQKISIGYMPEEFLMHLRINSFWNLKLAIMLLSLRLDKSGSLLKGGHRNQEYSQLDYTEVEKAIVLASNDFITTEEQLRAYIAEKRLQIQEHQIEKNLQVELNKIKAEQDIVFQEKLKALEEQVAREREGEFKTLSSKLQKALDEARQVREEKTSLAQKARSAQELQTQVARQNAAIAEKDAKVAELVEQMGNLRQQVSQQVRIEEREKARKETEAELAALKKSLLVQMNNESAERQKAAERYLAQKVSQLEIKAERTVQDGITHFIKLCAELDASLSNNIYNLLDKMSDGQMKDIIHQAIWLEERMKEVAKVLGEKLEKRTAVKKPLAIQGG